MLKTKEYIKAQKVKEGGTQLDFVDDIKNQTKQLKNQKFVTYSLVITFLLSSLLWLFTEIKHNLNQGKKLSINLPKINLPILNSKTSPSNTPSVQDIIDQNTNRDNIWSFYIASYQDQMQTFLYQKNISQLNQSPDDIKNNLQSLDQSTVNFFSSNLPQGLKILENLVEGQQSFQSEILVNLPSQKQILIISKSTNSKDLSQSKNTLSKIISPIYWAIVQTN